MTKAMKHTLQSVLVMAVIAVVAVGALAVANAFFPEYEAKLDKKTAALINRICPTGVDDATAFNDGWFAMADVDKDRLAELNTASGADKDNKVLAVYDVKKGEYQGYRVVESQAQGYGSNPVIIVLTSFDRDLTIDSVAVKQQKENPTGDNNIFNGRYFADFLAYVKDKPNAGTVAEIKAATSATNESSIKGLCNAVNVAAAVLNTLYGSVDPAPKAVTGTTLEALKKGSDSTSFVEYTPPVDMRQKVGLYKGDRGDVLVSGKAQGWGAMELLVTRDGAGKIGQVVIVVNNENIEGVKNEETRRFADDYNDRWLTERFAGKSLNDVKTADNVLSGTTGATLVKTAPAIRECLVNALAYYPLAEQYIDGIDAVEEGA